MNITQKTNNVTFAGSNTSYILNFGTIKKNSKAKTIINVEGEDIKIQTTNTSCSCTRADTNKITNNLTEVEITYKNTHLVQPFSKQVYLNVTEGSESKRVVIEVKGTVTN